MKERKQAAYRWGVDAETVAAGFLEKQGLAILAIRLRTQGGEVDILAMEGDTLVIVEVKARKLLEDGLFSITPAKQKRLARAAEAILMEADKIAGLENAAALNIRFDAVVISPANPPHHVPNAWYVE